MLKFLWLLLGSGALLGALWLSVQESRWRKQQLRQRFAAFVRNRIVFAGRPLGRLFPAVGEQALVFLSGKQRVERAFDDDHFGRFQLGNDRRGIGIVAGDDRKDAVFQNPFSHLY